MKITVRINASSSLDGSDMYSGWWNNDYDDISEMEVSWATGDTVDEVKKSVASAFREFPGYKFKTFMSYNGDQDVELYDIVMLCETPSGEEFIAQVDNNGRLLDVTPDVYEALGYADKSGYYL